MALTTGSFKLTLFLCGFNNGEFHADLVFVALTTGSFMLTLFLCGFNNGEFHAGLVFVWL